MKLNNLLKTFAMGAALVIPSLQSSASNTDVKVLMKAGDTSVYTVTPVGKVYFEGDNLLISTNGSTTDANISIAAIQKVLFAVNSSVSSVASESGLSISPVPATTQFQVNGVEGMAQVSVYSLSGVLVKSAVVSDGGSVSILGLASGVYIVKVNGVTFKLTKI